MDSIQNLYKKLTDSENEKVTNAFVYLYVFFIVVVFIIFIYCMYFRKKVIYLKPYTNSTKLLLTKPKTPEKKQPVLIRRKPTNLNQQSPIQKNYQNKFKISKIIT